MTDPTPVPAIAMPATVTLVSPRCPGCGTQLELEVTLEQAIEFKGGNGRLIQHIFPELDATTRERLKSGYCGPCWDQDMQELDEDPRIGNGPGDEDDLYADSGDYGVDDG